MAVSRETMRPGTADLYDRDCVAAGEPRRADGLFCRVGEVRMPETAGLAPSGVRTPPGSRTAVTSMAAIGCRLQLRPAGCSAF